MKRIDKKTTCHDAGKLGGSKTLERYGKEFYKEIGSRGGAKTKSRYGKEYYQEIGKSGGHARAEKLTPQQLSEIGSKAGRAPHPNGRGLQNVPEEKRIEIAKKGGAARD